MPSPRKASAVMCCPVKPLGTALRSEIPTLLIRRSYSSLKRDGTVARRAENKPVVCEEEVVNGASPPIVFIREPALEVVGEGDWQGAFRVVEIGGVGEVGGEAERLDVRVHVDWNRNLILSGSHCHSWPGDSWPRPRFSDCRPRHPHTTRRPRHPHTTRHSDSREDVHT